MADETGKITDQTKDFKGSGVEGKKEGEPDSAADRRARVRQGMVVAAIGELDQATEYTKSGKPDVKALEELLGFGIDAKERDAALAVFAANQDAKAGHDQKLADKDQEIEELKALNGSAKSAAPAAKQNTILTGEHVLAIQREQGKEV